MTVTKSLLAATILAAALVAVPGLDGRNSAQAACDPGIRIDGSTAETARKTFQSAGFRQIRDLKKGCDSHWHAVAVKDGAQMRVVLTPAGEIMPEAD